MNIVKAYFNSCSVFVLALPIVLFFLAFYIHYELVMGYYEDVYQYHDKTVKDPIFKGELTVFKLNFIGYSIIYALQIIGITITLNIGLLFLGYKVDFKKLTKMVLKSTLIFVLIYMVIPIVYYFSSTSYNFEELYELESQKFTVLRFLQNYDLAWAKNAFEMISIVQVAFIFFLAYGVKWLMKWKYKKSLLEVSKIYGVAFMVWLCFVLAMELNFK